MPTILQTLVKTRAAEMKLVFIFVLVAVLSGVWLLYDLAKLALLEMSIIIP